MSMLYLIRHGQASFGADDYDNLSDNGRRQSRILGASLATSGIRFTECWAGPLKRHHQTADETGAVFREAGQAIPPVQESKGLDEYNAEGVMKTLIPIIGESDSEFLQDAEKMFSSNRAFQRVLAHVMARWVSGQDDLPGIQPWSAFCRAAGKTLEEITGNISGDSQVLVFTSGGFISAAVGTVLGLHPEMAMAISWQLVNASVTRLQFGNGRISLDTFNERGHLEGHGENGLVTYR